MSGPILLLDVDGVLLPVTTEKTGDMRRCTVGGWPIDYSPSVSARIAEWHASGQVEVRWLTTWCEQAAELLAPEIGLPAFAVEGSADRLGAQGNLWWKSVTAQRISDGAPDRPLIWIDDDLDYSERAGEVDWLRDRSGRTLALSPNYRTGVTHKLLDIVDEFLAEVSR